METMDHTYVPLYIYIVIYYMGRVDIYIYMDMYIFVCSSIAMVDSLDLTNDVSIVRLIGTI